MLPASATTILTMQAELDRSNLLIPTDQTQAPHHGHPDNTGIPSSPDSEYEFDESQCLFCNKNSLDLDQNLAHMSKLHGLRVDTTNLLVDVGSLLAYLHLVISECHECLYCGTRRNTRQAIQQHMMAKGHCKYDMTDKDAELRDFYELSSSSAEVKVHEKLAAMRISDDPQLPSQARSRRTRPSKRPDRHSPSFSASPLDQIPVSSDVPTSAEPSSNTTETLSPSGQVSTRTLKQEHTLNNQLSQLRAGDQRNLAHLPASQQRALLATQHKQMEKARRTEQTQRGNLESAGNTFGGLSKTRLIRQPPHFGHVQSLKH